MILTLALVDTPINIPPVTAPSAAPGIGSAAKQAVEQFETRLGGLTSEFGEVKRALGLSAEQSGVDVFSGYLAVFFVAFIVTLLVVPLIRRLAIANNIIDMPDQTRKVHRLPVAYLGGLAVYLGMLAAIGFSYFAPLHGLIDFHTSKHIGENGFPVGVPMSIVAGMTVVMLVGFWDDVAKILPMQKVGGQLIAAALLAMNDVGTKVAKQVLTPIGTLIGNPELHWSMALPGFGTVQLDLIYWAGVVVIAVFVLGACNASNLIDGLDGLLGGVTAIAAGGLLFIAVWMAQGDAGPLDSARIILCLALMGACLGYLPHNWNPASIFLGDAGSLLLGYTTIVIVLTLGNEGATNLVLAGLVIYSIPIIDTTLAIVRRKMSGQAISSADANHLHHILKRALGVKGAVLTLYGMGFIFAIMGAAMIYGRSRISYAIFFVFAGFIAVIAIKAARRHQLEENAKKAALTPTTVLPPSPAGTPDPESTSTPAARA